MAKCQKGYMGSSNKKEISSEAIVRATYTLFPWLEFVFPQSNTKKVHFHPVSYKIVMESVKENSNEKKCFLFDRDGKKMWEVGESEKGLVDQTIEEAIALAEMKYGNDVYFIVGGLRDNCDEPWQIHISHPLDKKSSIKKELQAELAAATLIVNNMHGQ